MPPVFGFQTEYKNYNWKVALRVVQFWSEIKLVITNQTATFNTVVIEFLDMLNQS